MSGEWVATAIAVAAAGGAIWQAAEARGARNEAKTDAATAMEQARTARRAADSADASAVAAGRSADAQERLVDVVTEATKTPATAPAWEVTLGQIGVTASKYRITNVGTGPAVRVVLRGATPASGKNQHKPNPWAPGDAWVFMLGHQGGAVQNSLTVEALHRDPVAIQLPTTSGETVRADG